MYVRLKTRGMPACSTDVLASLRSVRQASGGPSEGSFANIRALKEQQQEQQRRAGATRDTQPRTRVTVESPSAAAARVAWEEARARRLAAEAAKAQVEERLKNAKSSGKKASPDSPQGPMASAARSTPHLSKQKPPKPSKVSSMFHNLVLGLNVQARPWEAPTKDLIALEQARRSLGNQQFILDKRTKVLKGLLNEVRARGGDDADTIKVLRDLIYRKISEEEAEKRLKAFEEGKKTEDKGMTLAEKEELARLEIKAQQLTLQKLVGTVY